jgi:starch synthase
MYEPGGISQLEAFSCGCFVIARATGGLRDTIFPIQVTDEEVEGNGFLFGDFTAASFYDAMERCHDFFGRADDALLYRARQSARNYVYHWDRAARRYIDTIYTIKEIIRSA